MFTSVQSKFSSFFSGRFYLECVEICWYVKKCPFLVFFGTTDGNFTEKYSVTPSWQRTCLWQMTGVRIVSCRSADFNMFQMTYKYRGLQRWKWGPRPPTSSRCYHGNKSAAPLKKSIFVHPPERLTACKIWRGVEIVHFPRCLILTETCS